MSLGPAQPAVSGSDEDLSQVNHFLGDPADCHGGGCCCANHRVTHLQGAALGQRLDRSPYATAPNVAMRIQGNPETKVKQRATCHRGTLKAHFFSFLLRYPRRGLSYADEYLGNLTYHRRPRSVADCLTRRHTRQQHQAKTPPIGISASSALAVMSVSLAFELRPRPTLFLTARHEINTQQRTARSISRARSAAEVKHA